MRPPVSFAPQPFRSWPGIARRTLATIGAASAFFAAGCIPAHQTSGPGERVQLEPRSDGPPLSDAASFEEPSEHPAEAPDTGSVASSLPPDGRSAAARIPSIVERGRLVVGVDQSQYLLSYRDSRSGELDGFEVQLAHEIARDIFGDPEAVEFRFIDAAQRQAALQDGRVDVIVRATTITEDRQHDIAFSVPYLTSHLRLLVPEDAGVSRLEDLGGRTLCVVEDSTGLRFARSTTTETRLLKTRNLSDCLVALQQNQADALLSDDVLLSGIAAQDAFTEIVGEPLTEEYYGVAVPQPEHTNPDDERAGLVRQINQTLERIARNGTWQRLFEAWFSAYLPTQDPPPARYQEGGTAQ